jgi:signal transduction histidine kinase
MAPARAYIRRTILDTALTTLILDAFCATLAVVLGAWLIGRPMRALMDKARRIGSGDFGGPLTLSQRDEIAELAREMNAMAERLVQANERAAEETRARIQMLEQLRHADRLMTVGKLASGVAHELGTPLNVVEARASMIADGEVGPAESADYARIIVRATEQMTKIIRQLLAFARPQATKKARCDLVQCARHTLDLLKPLAQKRRIELRLTAEPRVLAEADEGQIEQVITNLVMNAVHAIGDAGAVDVGVAHVRAQPPAGAGAGKGNASAEPSEFARVTVHDEGCGIDPESLARVFEPFFTTKDVGSGTGLGLFVTYGIIREHGGWIDVESTVGRGSDFTFYLPVAVSS